MTERRILSDSSVTNTPDQPMVFQAPSVLRDTGGRVRWRVKGNSEEENRQIGIANIRGLFFERHPEFLELFPLDENGKVQESEKEAAAEYIKVRVAHVSAFTAVFGDSARRRTSTSYFQGSHLFALNEAFKDLGVSEIKQSAKPRNYWTPEVVEREAEAFLQEHGKMTQKELINNGRDDLNSAIGRSYPGGLYALQTKLHVKSDIKPVGYWTEETIMMEAEAFFREHGDFNTALLTEHRRLDLYNALRVMPGGIGEVYNRLAIKPKRMPNGYWTEETIFQEAAAFYGEHRSLKHNLIREKRGGLLAAIATKYPGGLRSIQAQIISGVEHGLNSEVVIYPQDATRSSEVDKNIANMLEALKEKDG